MISLNLLAQESKMKMIGRNGKHVLVAYIMKPKAGYDYLATAAHFAAESSTGTNVNVCTTDDFTKSVDALVYYIDPDNEEMKIAYPTLLFDRNITDGRGMMCSFLTLAIGNNQGSLRICMKWSSFPYFLAIGAGATVFSKKTN